MLGYEELKVRRVLTASSELPTTAQNISAGTPWGGELVVRKRTGDPLVADTATLRPGPLASILPLVNVKLGQSLYGDEFHV